MTLFKITAVLAAGLGIALAVSSANARERLGNGKRWCLETSSDNRGGSTIFECNFATRAQCIASKVAQGDRCWRNER
jgi:hypothetical protein